MSANNMKEDEKPMHKFEGLKNLLKRRGYIVEKATGYKPVENKDVDLNDLRNNIEFTPDGIFLKDSNDGSKQQIFLYKRNYHLQAFGKPRFHIRQCQVIQGFINSGTFKAEYRRANTNVVKVRDMDDLNKDKDVENLPLCQFCLNMAKDAFSGMRTSDFVKILKQANEASEKDNDTEIDIFGYTKDWESVSRAYRELKELECQIFDKMNGTIIACLPASLYIKYSNYLFDNGTCYDRSLYMFLALDDALLVRGNNKYLEYSHGKGHEGHGWVEIGDYVYDPSLMLKFDKDIYYSLYECSNVTKTNKDEYYLEHSDFVNAYVSYDYNDFMPNGNRRLDLGILIYQIKVLSEMIGDISFIDDINNYLTKIKYNEDDITMERHAVLKKILNDDTKLSVISGK